MKLALELTLNPPPISPITFSTGTGTLSKDSSQAKRLQRWNINDMKMAQRLSNCLYVLMKGLLLDPLMPSLSSGLPLAIPPKALSTMNADILSFFTPSTSTSVLANTVMMSAMPPFEIQIWQHDSSQELQSEAELKSELKLGGNCSSHLGAVDQVMFSIFRQGCTGLNGGCVTATVTDRLSVSGAKTATCSGTWRRCHHHCVNAGWSHWVFNDDFGLQWLENNLTV